MPRFEERTPLLPAGPATDIETLSCFLELCSITAIKPAFPIDEQELAATVDATRESTRASLYLLCINDAIAGIPTEVERFRGYRDPQKLIIAKYIERKPVYEFQEENSLQSTKFKQLQRIGLKSFTENFNQAIIKRGFSLAPIESTCKKGQYSFSSPA
ncbi:hypothetical protein P3S54_09030 [Lactobacillus delbrueckii]|uniref:hypothetical protein n=1 Tax=Lactobacillus delbrueckii TaxID=1584 RepID=UPI0023E36B74|nr:hypothetical protein [Lactobacillus delbrueckii]MDF4030440.1 hypothetical protein [Lactobacillus delbrueckii]